MKCPDAARSIVSLVLQGGQAHPGADLAEHLRQCPGCVRRLAEYRAVRDAIRAMPPAEPPPELDQIMSEGLRQALDRPMQLDGPPADPTPQMPGQKKAAIAAVALIGILVAAVAGIALLGSPGAADTSSPGVVLAVGGVQVCVPGTHDWRPLTGREPLPVCSEVRTGPDALARVRHGAALWSLPPMARVAFGEGQQAELVVGRAYVECTGGEDVTEVLSGAGTVRCATGLLSVARSLERLKIGCIAGAATAGEGDEAVELRPGQVAVLTGGRPAGPVRAARGAELAHFLHLFPLHEGGRLTPRQLAAVPLRPDAPVLPPSVAIVALDVRAHLHGALALVEIALTLANEGPEVWQGELRPAGALLPSPLAEVPARGIVLEPGGRAVHEMAALCVVRAREERHALGLLPWVWTGGGIGRLTVQVEAPGESGLRRLACPTLAAAPKGSGITGWSGRREHVDPGIPIVIEYEPGRGPAVHQMAFPTEAGGVTVAAWQPRAPRDEWVRKGRSVIVAFDAAGEFGEGGAAAAHDALEVLLNTLPPATFSGLLAYDGTLKLEPNRLAPHSPERADTMLTALWGLADGAEPRPGDFLHEALSGAEATGESLVVFVTGRNVPGDLSACRQVLHRSRVRLAVLQIGADRPAPGYRDLAAASGGVALALPPAQAAELAVFDLLLGLRSAALRSVEAEAGGGVGARIVCGPADFADQPVVAVFRPDAAAAGARVRVTARSSADGTAQEDSFDPASPAVEWATPLRRAVGRALEDVCTGAPSSDRIP